MSLVPPLSKSEMLRYSRHLLLPELGLEGQQRLKAAEVLVVGAGGLGAPLLLYLAAAGVGTIGIVDFDVVDKSNLQRQIIYTDEDVALSKVKSAAQRARLLNGDIVINEHEMRLDASNALALFEQYEIVADGTDNFSTRYLINDACVMLKKPNVHGAIYRWEGQASVFSYAAGPCYRCLFPDPPPADSVPNCAEGGVLGVMAGIIGCIQATETIKIILGIGETLSGKLMLYDSLSMSFDTVPIPKSPLCPVCGPEPRIKTLVDTELSCKKEEDKMSERVINPVELDKELKDGKSLVLLDVRNWEEVALGSLPNSKHIPLADLPKRSEELEKDSDIVVYCKSGGRSMRAMQFLAERGFSKIRNLTGGILAWSRDVDPSLPQY